MTRYRDMTPEQRQKAKEREARWRAANGEWERANRLKNRDKINARKLADYYKNREKYRVQRAEQYRRNPEEAKQRAKQWRLDNPERAHQNKARYYADNREVLIRKQKDRYYRNHAQRLAEMAAHRAKNREAIRAWSKKRTASYCDSYIREQLSKNSMLSGKDFPPEMVELKRQHKLARKEILKYEKYERTA